MANADALSWLPLSTVHLEVPRIPEVTTHHYLDSTPLSNDQIRVWTASTLSSLETGAGRVT